MPLGSNIKGIFSLGKFAFYKVPSGEGLGPPEAKEERLSLAKKNARRKQSSATKIAMVFQCQGNLQEKTEDGDQGRPKPFPLEMTAWSRGPQIVT